MANAVSIFTTIVGLLGLTFIIAHAISGNAIVGVVACLFLYISITLTLTQIINGARPT